MSPSSAIFNRHRVRQHRQRAAGALASCDFLYREVAARMADRLPDIRRPFPLALDLGCHNGFLADYLQGMGGIETLVQADISENMVRHAPGLRVVADEEWLPFADNRFDLVMSVFSLHWINDLPGTLIQINRILKPDGLFLAMVPGGETLKELRQSFEQAEIGISGGISPRISPFIDVRDAGSLLQRAGFSMPVTDSEVVTVSYETPLKLLDDLRGMGETNALLTSSKSCIRRSVLFGALDYYQKHFGDQNKRVNATFEIVAMTAWKPDAGQK
jgi:NADH dehydrogenase [ubiquinone] 1 alpha subcomplex assembly factor 5